jgi:hypothetical protein
VVRRSPLCDCWHQRSTRRQACRWWQVKPEKRWPRLPRADSPVNRRPTSRRGLPKLLETLSSYPAETRAALEDFVQKMAAQGHEPARIGDQVRLWMEVNPPAISGVTERTGAGAQRLRAAAQARGPLVTGETPAGSGAPPGSPPVSRTAPLPADTASVAAPANMPSPTGPIQRAPVTKDQVAPQGRLSDITSAVNSMFQPIENLPDCPVKDALKRYAALVGPQSRGAQVVADTAARNIAVNGPRLSAERVPLESRAGVQSYMETKARADLNGVLRQAGLSENTPEIKASSTTSPTRRASLPIRWARQCWVPTLLSSNRYSA